MKSSIRHAAVSVLILSFVGILFRFGYQYYVYAGNLELTPFADEKTYYLAGARLLLEQGWSFFLTPRSLWTGPGNLLWVALFGGQVVLTKVMNLLLLAAVGVMVWDITRRLYGRKAALLALIFQTVHIPYCVFGPTLLSEPPFIFLLIASFWVLYIGIHMGGVVAVLVSGLLLGAAALTRPTVQLLPLAMLFFVTAAALIPARYWAGELRPRVGRVLLAYLLGFSLLVVPWFVKNAVVLDKNGLANGFGAVLYLGNDLRTAGDEPVFSGLQFDTIEITQPYAHLDNEGDRLLMNVAIDRMKQHPYDTFKLILTKPFRYLFGSSVAFFYPYRDLPSFFRGQQTTHAVLKCIEVILSVFVTVFGLIGLLTAPLRNFFQLLMLAVVIYFVGIHSLAFPISRLALPLFPVLAIFAAGALSGLVTGWRSFAGGLIAAGLVIYLFFFGSNPLPAVVDEHYKSYFTLQSEIDLESVTTNDLESVGGGRFNATGVDPFVVFRGELPNARLNQVVFIELAALPLADSSRARSDKVVGQLFWKSATHRKFAERRRADFIFALDGKTRVYRISPALSPHWKGGIDALRLDLGDDMKGVEYRLGKIEVRR